MALDDDIALVAEQERRLTLKAFDERTALEVGERLRKLAEAANEALSIDIRFWHRQLYFYAMPTTKADNIDWMRRKSNCVKRWDCASYALTLKQKRNGRGFAPDANVEDAEFAAHGGGFPIRIEGVGVVGSITVSGVPGRRDHGYVVRALCEHLGIDPGPLTLPPED